MEGGGDGSGLGRDRPTALSLKATLERPIGSSRKLPMRLDGPLSCCDAESSFQTLFFTVFTHTSYHAALGPRNSSPKAGDQRLFIPPEWGAPKGLVISGTEY